MTYLPNRDYTGDEISGAGYTRDEGGNIHLEVENNDSTGLIINEKKKPVRPSYKTELSKMRISRNKWRAYAILALVTLAALLIYNGLQ